MSKLKEISHELASGQVVTGTVSNMGELSARYQIWAEETHGVKPAESLACWVANQPERHGLYFETSEDVMKLAEKGFGKSKGPIPHLGKKKG